jgi:hypothetical protein
MIFFFYIIGSIHFRKNFGLFGTLNIYVRIKNIRLIFPINQKHIITYNLQVKVYLNPNRYLIQDLIYENIISKYGHSLQTTS